MDSFSEVVEMAIAVRWENPSCPGALSYAEFRGRPFEGQRNVNADSLPAPRRPYGFLKLAQEKILDNCDELIRLIYRPTSVYGFASLNRRIGLIPTLLLNGSQNQVAAVGAQSFVNKDVPEFHIVGGTPIRTIGQRDKDRLLEMESLLMLK